MTTSTALPTAALLAAEPTRIGRPKVVIVESVDEPRPTSIRVAKAFARAKLADILLCHWHALSFSTNAVGVRGSTYMMASDGTIRSVTLQNTIWVNALFFFAPHSGSIDEKDLDALRRLSAAGIVIEKAPLYLIVDRIMLEASCRGVVTNALGPDRSWGPKHQQETRLRQYEENTKKRIVRPETYSADPSQLASVFAIFASRGQACIVKPVFGDGGRGIKIVWPGESPRWMANIGEVVVQRLMPDPLLVNDHKVDLRCYLLIDVDNRETSGRLTPILVRRAAAVYSPGTLAGEITNTSVRLRQGLPPDIDPLDSISSINYKLRIAINWQLDLIARQLVEAYFWNGFAVASTQTVAANRVILFGMDVLVTVSSNQPCLYFLEINPFPALFRGSPPCDRAIDEMLALEYLPRLLKSGGAPDICGPSVITW